MWSIELVVMIAMIGVNSVFAGYEIALASVTVVRLQRLAQEGRHGARAALTMKQNMEASLAVVQLGITLVAAIAAAVGGAGAEKNLAPVLAAQWQVSGQTAEFLAIALVVLPLTVATILLGELVPKVFALRNAEWVCLTLSPGMRGFSLTVWPAVWFFEKTVSVLVSWSEGRFGRDDTFSSGTVVLQELRASAGLARASRLIGRREEEIILGAAELPSRPVGQIMLPLEHINVLHATGSLAENLAAANLDMHTRFPVVERPGDLQSILGYVNLKDIIVLLDRDPGQASLHPILRPIPAFPEDQSIAACLERLMRDRIHIALVRDRDGQVVGLITLEDILEELVGEIEDEYDQLPVHVHDTGSGWLVGGGATLAQIGAATGLVLPEDDLPPGSTLSHWVQAQLAREAHRGDVVMAQGVRVMVRNVRRDQVLEARISVP